MKYREWLKRKDLEYKENILYCGDLNLIDIAQKYGTPIYVVNEILIRKRYNALKKLLNKLYKKNQIHYAVKANSNISVLKILKSEGSAADCSSMGEIYLCLKAGFKSDDLIYTGNMFTNKDFNYALKHGVTINLDSISQLDRLSKTYEKRNIEKNLISFRINPEFGAGHHEHTITAGKKIKFGILENQVIKAYKKAKKSGFKNFGVHTHVGSGIINAMDYKRAIEKYIRIIEDLTSQLDIRLQFVDFGGGLGIPYKPKQDPLNLNDYRKNVIEPFLRLVEEKDIGDPILKIEPGRFIVGEASIILTQINTFKDNGFKKFVGIDAGFHTLIRPTMYGSYHHIIPCKRNTSSNLNEYDVAGPICESGDIIGKKRKFSNPEEGDFLAILDSGAYGYSMASNYNSRPRPKEILLHEQKDYIIRNSEELDDLINLQRVPKFLKD